MSETGQPPKIAGADRLVVAGEAIVRDGRLTRVDLAPAEAALRHDYRDRIGSRAAFLDAWPAAIAPYRNRFGCC